MLSVKFLRNHEIETLVNMYKSKVENKDLLEIGSGTGDKLKAFASIAKSIKGVDVEHGSCSKDMLENITYYDGHTLPFEDNSFDVIFSSNVLEHIPHINDMEKEFQRVLRKDGVAIHIMPNSIWRFYTMTVHYLTLPYQVAIFIMRRLPFFKNNNNIKLPGSDCPQVIQHTPLSLLHDFLIARRHGETGNRFTELYYFSGYFWKKHFNACKWKNVTAKPSGIFYCNYNLGLSAKIHILLSKILGSSTTIYYMEK